MAHPNGCAFFVGTSRHSASYSLKGNKRYVIFVKLHLLPISLNAIAKMQTNQADITHA